MVDVFTANVADFATVKFAGKIQDLPKKTLNVIFQTASLIKLFFEPGKGFWNSFWNPVNDEKLHVKEKPRILALALLIVHSEDSLLGQEQLIERHEYMNSYKRFRLNLR